MEKIQITQLQIKDLYCDEEFVELSRMSPEHNSSGLFLSSKTSFNTESRDNEILYISECKVFQDDIWDSSDSIEFDDAAIIDLEIDFDDLYGESLFDNDSRIVYQKSKYLTFVDFNGPMYRKRVGKSTITSKVSDAYSDFVKNPRKRSASIYRSVASDAYSIDDSELSDLEVHHMDLNRNNNTAENLVILEPKVHEHLHTLLDYENQLEVLEMFEKNLNLKKVMVEGIGTTYKRAIYYFNCGSNKPEEKKRIIEEEKDRIIGEISKILDAGLCEKVEIAVKRKEASATLDAESPRETVSQTYRREWKKYLEERTSKANDKTLQMD